VCDGGPGPAGRPVWTVASGPWACCRLGLYTVGISGMGCSGTGLRYPNYPE
jgi:hypothetical protein